MQRPAHSFYDDIRRSFSAGVHDAELFIGLLKAEDDKAWHAQFLQEGITFFLDFLVIHVKEGNGSFYFLGLRNQSNCAPNQHVVLRIFVER